MACDAKFKYVCEYKKKLDAVQSNIDDFSTNFVARYTKYELAVNKAVTTDRDTDASKNFSKVANINYDTYKNIMAQLETLKNEISKNMNENSDIIERNGFKHQPKQKNPRRCFCQYGFADRPSERILPVL